MRDFWGRFCHVPYVMPGFELAKMAAKVHDETPHIEGLLLAKHGHFTWGDDAKESYDRVIDQTNKVEEWLAQYRAQRSMQVKKPQAHEQQDFLLKLRGALVDCSGSAKTPVIFNVIQTEDTLRFLCRNDVSMHAKAGVDTPDHVIRTKARPLLLDQTVKKSRQGIAEHISSYVTDYKSYFQRCAESSAALKTMLSPLPKLIWAEGIGLIGVGANAKEARVITDLAQQNIQVMADGADAGGFNPVEEQDLFDLEYWSLEQAKLGNSKPPAMQGQVVIVTGGAGAIGSAIAKEFHAAGAEIVLIDKNIEQLQQVQSQLIKSFNIEIDVTQPDAPNRIIDAVSKHLAALTF